MRPFRRFATLALVVLVLAAVPAMAVEQTSTPAPTGSPTGPVLQEPPAVPPGLCAPWHKCIAQGTMAVMVLILLFMGAMWMYQRRGFDTIEHRQGNPEGVPVKRE